MGHKVNPLGLRVRSIDDWHSVWYAEKDLYVSYLIEDFAIRKCLNSSVYSSYIEKITIKRIKKTINLVIFTSRPGLIIGQKGQDIEKIKKILKSVTEHDIEVDVIEVKNISSSASLVARSISYQLEKRFSFRRAMKKSMYNAMHSFGVKGIKIKCSGRLGGVDIARSEWYVEGSVPLHRLKADIDYSFAEANTTYGKIGVKVWLYKGDIIKKNKV